MSRVTRLALLLLPTVALAQNAPAPVAPRVAVCGATLHGAFHLRPVVTGVRIGREVAGRATPVEVLALTGLRRHRDEAVLARVRVPPLGEEGYAFVRPAEFATDCPLVALGRDEGAVPHAPEAMAPAPRRRRPSGEVFRGNGTHDFTGDGRDDEILHIGSAWSGDYVLQWREAGRLNYATVAFFDDRLRHSTVVSPLDTTGAALIWWRWYANPGSTWGCAPAEAVGVAMGDVQDALYRWHPSGRVVAVWRWRPDVHADAVRLEPAADGHLVVVGERSRRRQRLLWDAERFTFIPEGPTFPAEDDTFHCNPSPRAPYEDRG